MDTGTRRFMSPSPAPGNTSNWRSGWRSSSGDRGGQQPTQQQYPSGQRRWSQGSADQQPQRSSTHHHLVAVDAMSVDNRVVIPTSMDQERCLPKHLRPWDALSVDREVAIPPAMRQTFSNRFQMLQACQRDRLQHLLWMLPARSQTGSGARDRASGPRRSAFLCALRTIKSNPCVYPHTDG